ncbi:hypothetical protein RB195_023343 [Necator americanus]|uniref:Uncharacterized protein n=1 Tax=Necator americanus TaxID=51031 RepID=A0ABR1EIT4_NECAM
MKNATPRTEEEELNRRMRAAWAAFAGVREATDQLTNQDLRTHLFDSTVFPPLCYAAETWADSAVTSRKLLTTHRALERCLLKFNRRTQHLAGLRSSDLRGMTSSTSLTKLENILDDNGDGKKRVEEMLGPARPVKTGHLSKAFLDAKRKLRLVLSSADNIPTMPFDGNCSGMKQEDEREQLILLLRTLLAEAVSGREQGLVAHTREVMRCLQIFDNKGICKLLRTMKEEYRRRSSYLLYLQQSRVTLLRLSTYIEKLMLRTQREKTLVEECLVEVLVRFYMENKDLQVKRFLQEFVALNAQVLVLLL